MPLERLKRQANNFEQTKCPGHQSQLLDYSPKAEIVRSTNQQSNLRAEQYSCNHHHDCRDVC